jgi:ankyrin repeat protein
MNRMNIRFIFCLTLYTLMAPAAPTKTTPLAPVQQQIDATDSPLPSNEFAKKQSSCTKALANTECECTQAPTIKQSWKKLLYLQWNSFSKKDVWNIGKSITIPIATFCSILLLLRQKRIDDNNADLLRAARNGDIDTITNALNRGTNINITRYGGETALIAAVKNGHTEAVRLLIERGANVNLADSQGSTPLIWAIRHNSTEIVHLLIARGANLNLRDRGGHTALMLAITTNCTEIARLLIARGANVNLADNWGNTALMRAARYDNIEIVQLLITHGANLNLRDRDGHTALNICNSNITTEQLRTLLTHATFFQAAQDGDRNIMQSIMHRIADINMRNNNNQTAFDIARNNNHIEIIQFLTAETERRQAREIERERQQVQEQQAQAERAREQALQRERAEALRRERSRRGRELFEKAVAAGQQCPICLEIDLNDMENKENNLLVPTCMNGHIAHFICAEQLYAAQPYGGINKCPRCRGLMPCPFSEDGIARPAAEVVPDGALPTDYEERNEQQERNYQEL